MKVSVERLRWGLAAAVVLLVAGLLALVSYGRYAATRKWKELLAHGGIHITQETDNVTYSQTVKGRTVFTMRAKKAIPISQGKWTLRGVTLLLYGKTSDRVDRVEGAEFEYDEKAGIAKAIGDVHMDIQAPGALSRSQHSGQITPASNGGAASETGENQELEQNGNVIHVLTSGLVYLRKLGVAATDQRVEFRYAGMTCVSQGAEFDTTGNSLHLLANVEMTGDLHGRPAVVRAARADLDREKNTIAVLQPVASAKTSAGGESARAASALLWLHADGSLQHADATGDVVLENAARRVAAQRLQAEFGEQNVPQSAVLSGGVTLDGSAAKPMHGTAAEADLLFTASGAVKSVVAKHSVDLVARTPLPGAPAAAREMRGEQVAATFRPVGSGKQMSLREVHVAGSAFARGESFAASKPGTKAAPGMATSGMVTTLVSADDLLATFVPAAGKGKESTLQHLTGQGHTHLEQDGLNGAQEVSSGDALDVLFAPDNRAGTGQAHGAGLGNGFGSGMEGFRLQMAVQTGHVQIRDQQAGLGTPGLGTKEGGKRGALSLAQGSRAAFDAATDRLTLTGGAEYQQEGASLSANSLVVEQSTGNAEAQGNVEASLSSKGSPARSEPGGAAGRSVDQEATHVLAERAKLMRAAQTAEFFGTDAHPARMWQGGSQVMAANLFLDDAHQSLSARPAGSGAMVEAVFAAKPADGAVKPERPAGTKAALATPRGGGIDSGSGVVHVSTPALNYSGQRHEAVCSGGVRMREGDMQIRAQQAVMFLGEEIAQGKPATETSGVGASGAASTREAGVTEGPGELGGRLERVVFSGSVRMDEPGRAGEGEQLVYTAKDGNYLLTGSPGKPPRVADAVQGMVTGPALLFQSAGNGSAEKTVIVNGSGASNGHDGNHGAGTPAGGRVHTDVTVKPQP